MFNELYGLVNRNIKNTIDSDRSIPRTKRGALIAETTTGILHVINGLNEENTSYSPWRCCFHEQFPVLSEYQLHWRFMLHLGFDERQSGRIIGNILPIITPALQEHYNSLNTMTH